MVQYIYIKIYNLAVIACANNFLEKTDNKICIIRNKTDLLLPETGSLKDDIQKELLLSSEPEPEIKHPPLPRMNDYTLENEKLKGILKCLNQDFIENKNKDSHGKKTLSFDKDLIKIHTYIEEEIEQDNDYYSDISDESDCFADEENDDDDFDDEDLVENPFFQPELVDSGEKKTQCDSGLESIESLKIKPDLEVDSRPLKTDHKNSHEIIDFRNRMLSGVSLNLENISSTNSLSNPVSQKENDNIKGHNYEFSGKECFTEEASVGNPKKASFELKELMEKLEDVENTDNFLRKEETRIPNKSNKTEEITEEKPYFLLKSNGKEITKLYPIHFDSGNDICFFTEKPSVETINFMKNAFLNGKIKFDLSKIENDKNYLVLKPSRCCSITHTDGIQGNNSDFFTVDEGILNNIEQKSGENPDIRNSDEKESQTASYIRRSVQTQSSTSELKKIKNNKKKLSFTKRNRFSTDDKTPNKKVDLTEFFRGVSNFRNQRNEDDKEKKVSDLV